MNRKRRAMTDPDFDRYFTLDSVKNSLEKKRSKPHRACPSRSPDKRRSCSRFDSENKSKSPGTSVRLRSHSPPKVANTSATMTIYTLKGPSRTCMLYIQRPSTDAEGSSQEPAILGPLICKPVDKVLHISKAKAIKQLEENPVVDDYGVVSYWKDVAREGLSKEESAEIVARYPRPVSCSCFDPPKLNREMECATDKEELTRDCRLVAKQANCSAGLSGVAKVMNMLVKQEPSKIDKYAIMNVLVDVGKLLADVFHDTSCIRRSRSLANVDASALVKRVLERSEIGELLFGDNLAEAKNLDSMMRE